MLKRIFQRSLSRTTFQQAIQKQIVQEDGKENMRIIDISLINLYRINAIEKRK